MRRLTATKDRDTAIERATATLYEDVHLLKIRGDEEKELQKRRAILTPALLGVNDDFFHGKVCLDAGCGGLGRAIYSMASRGARFVYAIDISQENVRTSRYFNQEFADRIDVQVASVLNLPFADRIFDFVHCSAVLHHTVNARKGFGELARVLRPGGMLYISVHGAGGLISFLIRVGRAIVRLVPFELTKRVLPLLFEPGFVGGLLDVLYVRIHERYKEAEILQWFEMEGLSNVRRLNNHNWIFKKRYWLEQWLTPSSHNPDTLPTRLLFGDCWIQMTGEKPVSMISERQE